MLLTEAIDLLCIATRANGRSVRTVKNYREKLGHLLRFLGDVEVELLCGYRWVFLCDHPVGGSDGCHQGRDSGMDRRPTTDIVNGRHGEKPGGKRVVGEASELMPPEWVNSTWH